MRLEDIFHNPEIMENLRWDLDKEKLLKQPETFDKEDAGFYFCIYVRNYRACLALLHYYPDGKAIQDCIAGFPEDMIQTAVKEAGAGGIHGRYLPINKPIEDILRLGLMAGPQNRQGIKSSRERL